MKLLQKSSYILLLNDFYDSNFFMLLINMITTTNMNIMFQVELILLQFLL